jgi:hypothetical protein
MGGIAFIDKRKIEVEALTKFLRERIPKFVEIQVTTDAFNPGGHFSRRYKEAFGVSPRGLAQELVNYLNKPMGED